jgi:L-seryl-tRNA(Ser) seleniumtransferase
MLTAGEEELAARAELMSAALAAAGVDARVIRAEAKVGGGALPLLELRGPAVALDASAAGPAALAAALRAGDPPLVGRIHAGELLLDPRTLADDEIDAAAAAVRRGRG